MVKPGGAPSADIPVGCLVPLLTKEQVGALLSLMTGTLPGWPLGQGEGLWPGARPNPWP